VEDAAAACRAYVAARNRFQHIPAPTTSSAWRLARCLAVLRLYAPLLINTRRGSKLWFCKSISRSLLPQLQASLIKSAASKAGLMTAVTMAVSFFGSGFPADIKTLLTAAAVGTAAAATTIGDATVDRSQLLREHQWSMVFRLTKLVRRKVQEQQRRRDPFNVGP